MKNGLTTLLIALAILSAGQTIAKEVVLDTPVGPVYAQPVSDKSVPQMDEYKVKPAVQSPEERKAAFEQRKETFEQRINLTEEQKDKIKKINVQTGKDLEKIRTNAKKKIDAVYTPEQREEIAKIKKEREESFKQKMLEMQQYSEQPVSDVKPGRNYPSDAECVKGVCPDGCKSHAKADCPCSKEKCDEACCSDDKKCDEACGKCDKSNTKKGCPIDKVKK